MEENPYQPPEGQPTAPACHTRSEAATWAAKFGGKVGAAVGGVVALSIIVVRSVRGQRMPSFTVTAENVVLLALIVGILAAFLGAAIGFVTGYKPSGDKKNHK